MSRLTARGLLMLGLAAGIAVVGGLLAIALSGSGDIDEDTAAVLVEVGMFSTAAGIVQGVFVALARRRNGAAAAVLVAVSIGMAVIALFDTIAALELAGPTFFLAALRLALNVAGAGLVVANRRWFDAAGRVIRA